MNKYSTIGVSAFAALLLLAACSSRDPLARQDCFGATGITNTRNTPSCPEGTVYFNNACTPRADVPENAAFTCQDKDEPGCTTQCKLGDDTSCDLLASILLSKNKTTSSYGLEDNRSNDEDISSYSPLETAFISSVKPLIKRMEDTCHTGGAPNACVAAAAGISLRDDKDDLPKTGPTLTAFAALMEQGCRDGQDAACGVMEQLYGTENGWGNNDRYGEHAITRNIRKLEGIISEGCDTGSAKACSRMAYYFVGTFNLDDDFKPNYKKAAKYWSAACLGDITDDCIYATAAYMTSNPDECTRFFKEHLVEDELELCLGVPCAPDEDAEIASFCKLSAGLENKKIAYFTAAKACGQEDNLEAERLCKTAEIFKPFAAAP